MRFLSLLLLSLITLTFSANALEIQAKSSYVIHPKTGTIVFSKKASMPQGPASLTKMMTLYMLFDALTHSTITLNSALPVSEKAWRKGGSKMFVEVGKTVTVEDLIRGIIISSGNDACIVVAEHLGGTEENFATMMTRKAKEIGLKNTTFTNASGWPNPLQKTTTRDITLLGSALIKDFPQFYPYFSETSFTYSGIKQPNRNTLLTRQIGVDGLKTGHTEEDGFHLVASAIRGGERLVATVMGADSMAQRANQGQAVLAYAYAGSATKRLVKKGQILVPNLTVHMGKSLTTSLATAADLALFLTPDLTEKLTASLTYTQPLTAPIKKGAQVGILTITTPYQTFTIPLVTTENITKLSFWGRYLRNAFGKLGF